MLKEPYVGQPIHFSPLSRWTTLLSWIKVKVLGRRVRFKIWVKWLYLVESWRLGLGYEAKILKTNRGPIIGGLSRYLMGWPPSCDKILLATSSVLFKLLLFGWNLTNKMHFNFLHLISFLAMTGLLNQQKGFHVTLIKQSNGAISYIKN